MKLKEIFETANDVMSLEEIEQALDTIYDDADGEPSPQVKKMANQISKMIKGNLTSAEQRAISVKMEKLLDLVRTENES